MPGLEGKEYNQVADLISKLNAVRKKARIFPAGHSYVQEGIHDLMETLEGLFQELTAVTISVLKKEL